VTTLSPPPQTRTIGTALIAGKPVPVQADIAWFRYWAQSLYDRAGGATGLSNTELASLIAALDLGIDAIDTRVDALEAESMFVPALQFDYIDDTTFYRGEAVPGTATSAALWRVQRITITGDDLVIEWADGSANFTKIWDDRLSLTYS